MARKALLIALTLILALAAPALAQKKSSGKTPTPLSGSPSDTAAAANRMFTEFGSTWTAMTAKERSYYIDGMASAFRLLCTNAVMAGDKKPASMEEADKIYKECFLSNFPYKPHDIVAAMTALYADKLNNHIPFDVMYGFALMKVGNKPYDENLVKIRADVEKRLSAGK